MVLFYCTKSIAHTQRLRRSQARFLGLCFFIAMQDYAKGLYKSKAWQRCRAAYIKSVGGLCERCLANGLYVPGEIVHHKIYISPANISNPEITLNFNNLELLCRDCHGKEHKTNEKRYKVDELGRVVFD